jgi:transposase-like protein
MTAAPAIVDAEVVDDMNAETARELLGYVNAQLADVWHNVKRLYRGRAWLALGYSSWDEMCRREIDTSHLRLPAEERQETLASLREAGLSIRAIASATGVARNTVRAGLRSDVGQIDPPVEVQGRDGKTYKVAPSSPSARKIPTADDESVIVVHSLPEPVEPEACDTTDPASPCGPDNSFETALRAARTFLESLCDSPTPEQARQVRNLLNRYVTKLGREGAGSPAPSADDATTEWSTAVQHISASAPMETLTEQQVLWLQGAAEYLANYCRGELVTRKGDAA